MRWIAKLSRTHITIVVIGIIAFVSSFAYLKSLDKTIFVAKLSKNIAAGSPIKNNDITFVEISDDPVIKSQLITKESFSSGKIMASNDLSRSDLLTKSNTTRKATAAGLQSLSIGVEIYKANGGDIKKGDLLDVWKTGDDAALVASSTLVRNVILPNKRLGVSTTQLITVVLAVTPEQSRSLSHVIGTDNLMLVLSNGVNTSADENIYQPFVQSDLDAASGE